MKINRIEYHDTHSGWHLCPADFSRQNLALLVGVSAAGKTRILEAIMNLKKIANGSSMNGIKWDITFTSGTDEATEYRWQGEFENKELTEEDHFNKGGQFQVIHEELSSSKRKIIKRDQAGITFNGVRTPKLSPFQSAVELLHQEDEILPAYSGFKKIVCSDHSDLRFMNRTYGMSFARFERLTTSDTLKTIQDTNLPVEAKLAWVYKNNPEVFHKIKTHFIDIFPQVEDVKVEPVRAKDDPAVITFPIQIRERGVKQWIHQRTMSSGMLRAFKHLSELYLLPAGSVILIDEFENSLGVNCMDVLTENLFRNRSLQFIITSHHPYIINNVGVEHWKIVTRKKGVVRVKDAKAFNLGKTKHSAFMELLQLEEYVDGVEI